MKTLKTLVLAFSLLATQTITAFAEKSIMVLSGINSANQQAILKSASKVFYGINVGDDLIFYDGVNQRVIADIQLPNDDHFAHPKQRTKKFGRQMYAFKNFIEQEGALASSYLKFPQMLRELSNNVLRRGELEPAHVLVIGSPLYRDDKEPAFNMVDGFFPSDGHLFVDSNISPFGITNRFGTLKQTVVHFCETETAWQNDLHRQRVHRFWYLYVAKLGGVLSSFTADLQTCLDRFQNRATDVAENFLIDGNQTEPMMLSVTRSTEQSVELAKELPVSRLAFDSGAAFLGKNIIVSNIPPTTTIGKMKIGIRWDGACDIDIYARGSKKYPYLFFKQLDTPEGFYDEDFKESPQDGFEFIEFTQPIDLTTAQASINYHSKRCRGGVDGVVRILFDSHVYEQSFRYDIENGNEGAGQATKDLAPYWIKLDLMQVVGLRHGGDAS